MFYNPEKKKLRNYRSKRVFLYILIGFSIVFILHYLTADVPKTSGPEFIFYDSSLYENYNQEYVVVETAKFALNQTEEDDPNLIEFVRKLIKPPPYKKPYNLEKNRVNGDYSQECQSLYIDKIFNHKNNGFFISTLIPRFLIVFNPWSKTKKI